MPWQAWWHDDPADFHWKPSRKRGNELLYWHCQLLVWAQLVGFGFTQTFLAKQNPKTKLGLSDFGGL